jgi:adenylate cyclase
MGVSRFKLSKVNISQSTYDLLKGNPDYTFEYLTEMEVKEKGKMGMYFVASEKLEIPFV